MLTYNYFIEIKTSSNYWRSFVALRMTKKIHLTNFKSSLCVDFIYIFFIEFTLKEIKMDLKKLLQQKYKIKKDINENATVKLTFKNGILYESEITKEEVINLFGNGNNEKGSKITTIISSKFINKID